MGKPVKGLYIHHDVVKGSILSYAHLCIRNIKSVCHQPTGCLASKALRKSKWQSSLAIFAVLFLPFSSLLTEVMQHFAAMASTL